MIRKMKNMIFRFFSYLWHQISAWNTTGEGIHSPYLFYIVRFLLHENARYYSWEDIENRRLAMLHAPKMLNVTDYGTGRNLSSQRLVSDIAKNHLETAQAGQFLFCLVLFLTEKSKTPLNIVELGTSLGITTAYLASPDSKNTVWTFEGSEEVAQMAQLNWKKLALNNIQSIVGNIDDTLLDNARVRENMDIHFAFLDANHTEEATLRYFRALLPHATEKSVFAVDDIHYSPEMWRAWKQIKNMPEVTSTIDLGNMGLVFFDPHFLKRHYMCRL